jgi:hypothetical protein
VPSAPETTTLKNRKNGEAIPFTPLPTSTKAELNRSNRLGGNHQNNILFNHGNAMSGAPIGTNQFPNPPIIVGITIKKIIKKHEPLLKHYKVDDSHQEFDRRVGLFPYETLHHGTLWIELLKF